MSESAVSRALRFRSVPGSQAIPSSAPESNPLLTHTAAHPDLFALLVVIAGFCWRVWMAHATFFNTDEAWHYSVANQNSLLAVYKASLTLAHPPVMVFVLYFWRHLGTSDLMIRMLEVLAGTLFCWIFYKWLSGLFGQPAAICGLIFAALLPPMIALSSEVRQYSLMLMFAAATAYFLERALAANSARLMLFSSISLWLAMLSHYSAFLFAASVGIYAILRIVQERPSSSLIAMWAMGQAAGVAIAAFLYKTHIAKLGAVYPVAQPLRRFGDFYIADWYFHPGRDYLLHFLYRGTLGVFRFAFGHTGVGQIAAVLFVAGVVLLALPPSESTRPHRATLAALLAVPFALNWIAVAAGLFPYGRTRQCVYLAVFGFSGVAIALTRMCHDRSFPAGVLALVMVAICQLFGTLQGRDMLPLSEQRHEHMDQAIQFLRSDVVPGDVIFTDKATSYQLQRYLCGKAPIEADSVWEGFDVFHCQSFRVLSTGSGEGALTAAVVEAKWHTVRGFPDVIGDVWIVQGGWASRLGEELYRSGTLDNMQLHTFGRYLEVLKMPTGRSISPASQPGR